MPCHALELITAIVSLICQTQPAQSIDMYFSMDKNGNSYRIMEPCSKQTDCETVISVLTVVATNSLSSQHCDYSAV